MRLIVQHDDGSIATYDAVSVEVQSWPEEPLNIEMEDYTLKITDPERATR